LKLTPLTLQIQIEPTISKSCATALFASKEKSEDIPQHGLSEFGMRKLFSFRASLQTKRWFWMRNISETGASSYLANMEKDLEDHLLISRDISGATQRIQPVYQFPLL
jgi:hypothetical protein